MSFAPLPATAAWHHRGARSGFEVVYFQARGGWWLIEGWTTAIEDGATWAVEYAIEVDAAWATRSARLRGRSAAGFSSALLEADGAGHWLVGGRALERAINETQRFLVRALGQDLLLLYPEEWKSEKSDED